MLMARLSFSQSGYPKLIVYNGDTLVALTVKQAVTINVTKLEGEMYQQLADSLSEDRKRLKLVITTQDSLIASLKREGMIQDTMYANCQLIIKDLEAQIKKKDRQIKWLKVQRAVLIASTGVATLGAVIIGVVKK